MENNLFTELASPDEGADHHAHLAYLVSLLEAFEQTGDARIKPMRRKLHTAIIELTEGTEQGLSTEELALKFQKRIADLQVQTYEVLNIVVNQLRATLRMKLKRSPPMVGGVNMQELQDNLGNYAQSIRGLLNVLKKESSPDQARDAYEEFERASAVLGVSAEGLG